MILIANKNIYIAQIDGKDLVLANNNESGGYTLLNKNKMLNHKRFKASFDYSLDLIRLREIYRKVYRNNKFSSFIDRKEYCTHIVNVTFKYSVKEFNQVKPNVYLKFGYNMENVTWKDSIGRINGNVVAVNVKDTVEVPIKQKYLGEYFYFDNGHYNAKRNIKCILPLNEVRAQLYKDGFECDGVKYIRWKRSSGSARVGKCLFINETLYYRLHKWEMCGLKIRDRDNVDLAALESYISLTSSSIIDTIEIKPINLLVIDDYESIFNDDVINVTDIDGRLAAKHEITEIRNSIFDGESIIDISAMGKYSSKGMLLLRNRFFKSCCFNGNIQKWFYDHNIKDVSQLNGFTLAQKIEDIKLITTPSSIKYMKFSTLEKWFENLSPVFGIVKYEKPTHFMDGKLVQTHYQLINSIQLSNDEVKEFLQPTFDFMDLLRTRPEVLRHWIKYSIANEITETPVKSKSEVVYKMMSVNENFYKTKFYNDFKLDYIKAFTKEVKSGHVLINGNYSTLCGNPIEMLSSAIGCFTGKSTISKGSVCSKRFKFSTPLLCSRSPHISMSNVVLVENEFNQLINIYMNPTEEILFINSIDNNILQQMAGCDFDSDSSLITDNSILIEATKRNEDKFKVAVCNVSSNTRSRRYTKEEMADLDIKTSKNLIGEIINLSQELNTLIWDALSDGKGLDEINGIYLDVCKLSIMSGLEIDKAKKEFLIDNAKELADIRLKYKIEQDGKSVKPNFFGHIARQKGYFVPHKKIYKRQNTAMDYLQHHVNSYRLSQKSICVKEIIPFSYIINCKGFWRKNVKFQIIDEILNLVEDLNSFAHFIYQDKTMSKYEQYLTVANAKIELHQKIGLMKINRDTMIRLLQILEDDKQKKIRRLLFFTLFGYPNTDFYKLIKHSVSDIAVLEKDDQGEIFIFTNNYNIKYTKIS